MTANHDKGLIKAHPLSLTKLFHSPIVINKKNAKNQTMTHWEIQVCDTPFASTTLKSGLPANTEVFKKHKGASGYGYEYREILYPQISERGE